MSAPKPMTTHERAEKMVEKAVGFKYRNFRAEEWRLRQLYMLAVRLQAEILERESGDKR